VDDGRGKKTELSTQKKHKSVGTKNVKTRLKILCNGEYTLNKTPDGTESIIKIPLDLAKNRQI
jgi:signal transduction histidine kinase